MKNRLFLILDAQVGLDLMEHIPHVVTICHETPHLFDNIFHNHLLDIIIRYLQDQDNQVNILITFLYAVDRQSFLPSISIFSSYDLCRFRDTFR